MTNPNCKRRDPTPKQIARRAAKIREEWSEAERLRRWVGPKASGWKVPQVKAVREV